ncbi:hypothetical protein [Thermodesulfovibrio thiophilus]|uniref:hypothetical protein n=1 Tax=Thermodesulfovibrio thiophilus TaxID=340095 RepID=UPI00041D2919|nr:hypothetical protein [Thermodesulfovibrio thiophilus]
MRLIGVIKCFLIALILPLNLYAITLEKCNEQDIKGIYNFIIYSNTYDHDLETFIVLDRVDDNIDIIPYAPEFKYMIIKNVNEKSALQTANEILKNSLSVSAMKCSIIKDEDNIIGYELKSIYFPWVYGVLEPVQTVYKKKDNTVEIFVTLNPHVQKQIDTNGLPGQN